MSDVRSIGTMDDEGFATATPRETEVLHGFIAWDAAREAEGVIKE
jgi:hypothetical protein